jgi:DNA-binding response OmpR family regulator
MKKNKKILIIEDESILAEMYRDKFENSGFKVFTAIEVREGLDLAQKEKPDLIILDILLPEENGTAFLEKRKANSKISSIPVVVLSNFDDPQTRLIAEELGAKNYLLKTNYDPKELLGEIKKYLKN